MYTYNVLYTHFEFACLSETLRLDQSPDGFRSSGVIVAMASSTGRTQQSIYEMLVGLCLV